MAHRQGGVSERVLRVLGNVGAIIAVISLIPMRSGDGWVAHWPLWLVCATGALTLTLAHRALRQRAHQRYFRSHLELVTPPEPPEPLARFTMRSSRYTYFMFCVMFGGPALLLVTVALVADKHFPWGIVLIFAVPLTLFLVWIHAFRVDIEDDDIAYTTLFGETRRLRLADICRYRTGEATHEEMTVYGYPPFYLVLEPTPALGVPPVYINIKPFSLKDIQQLDQLLMARGIPCGRRQRNHRSRTR